MNMNNQSILSHTGTDAYYRHAPASLLRRTGEKGRNPYDGLRPWSAATHGAGAVLAALGIYATFPVLKNTYAGLVSVDPQYLEAARGCGMSPWQSLLRVELPLALPTIIGGLRMSTVYTVSWAVMASMIGLGGLGDFIYAGLSSNDNALILLGAIPAALLAFALGTLVDLLQRRTVPKGLRKGGSAT